MSFSGRCIVNRDRIPNVRSGAGKKLSSDSQKSQMNEKSYGLLKEARFFSAGSQILISRNSPAMNCQFGIMHRRRKTAECVRFDYSLLQLNSSSIRSCEEDEETIPVPERKHGVLNMSD